MLSGSHSRGGTFKNKSCVHLMAAIALFIMRDLQGAIAETVFFNSYGDCNQEAFFLSDDVYTLQATGAQEMHETLICELTFRAPRDTGICLTFKNFRIDDCGVSLRIYHDPTAAGKHWKKLTCENYNPPQLCTPERYVTLRLQKRKLNLNRDYQFEIIVEKSSNLKGEDVILASSIGLFVGIIAGVVALIVLFAVIVLCCCCKPFKSQQLVYKTSTPQSAAQQPALPTAPPAVEIEECTPLQAGAGGALYPALPQPYPGSCGVSEQPPPYAPPPYECHDYPTKV